MTQRFEDINLDTQPEPDQPGFRLLSLGTGLILACGLILGALLGGLAGHFLFNDVFGTTGDIVVGAIVGAIIIDILGFVAIRRLSARMETTYQQSHYPDTR